MAYYGFIRVQEVYTINVQIYYFFCINILKTNKNPYMRPLLLQITVWEVREDRARLGCLGTNWKRVFYGKLTRMTTPTIFTLGNYGLKLGQTLFGRERMGPCDRKKSNMVAQKRTYYWDQRSMKQSEITIRTPDFKCIQVERSLWNIQSAGKRGWGCCESQIWSASVSTWAQNQSCGSKTQATRQVAGQVRFQVRSQVRSKVRLQVRSSQ